MRNGHVLKTNARNFISVESSLWALITFNFDILEANFEVLIFMCYEKVWGLQHPTSFKCNHNDYNYSDIQIYQYIIDS